MLWRNSRGRPLNAPAAFISPVPRYDCEVSRAASSQFLCLIRNVFPNVCCCFEAYREEGGSRSCTTVEREDPCVNQYSEYSRSPPLPRRSQSMLPPHKCETTGLVVQVVPQLAVALKQHNPRHLQAEAPVSSRPRARFPRQRQPRANVPTPCQRQGWVSPHPRARFPRQRQPRANVPTPYQRQGWVSPHPPRARVRLRQGHPPMLPQQAAKPWLLLFARPTVTLEHTDEATGTVVANETN